MVTLYDDEGKWKTDGTGYLNSSDLSSVPGVGDKPFSMFTDGEENGAWNQNLGITIDRSTFPIFLFSYGREDSPIDDRGGKKFRTAMLAAVQSASGLENVLRITDFSVDGSMSVSGAVEAMVRDAATGEVLAQAEIDGRTVTVYGAKSPAGPRKKIAVLRTGRAGEWLVDRVRDYTYFTIGLGDGI